jgi:hypothetical protein
VLTVQVIGGNMKKGIAVLYFSFLFLFLFVGSAESKVIFGFKLTGGLNYLQGGDLNKGLQGWSDIWNKLYDDPGITRSGGYKSFHLGMDLNIELLMWISPRIAFGLGTGYVQVSRSSELQLIEGGITYKNTWSPKITFIPITLSLYYNILNGKRFRFIIHAGAGYYLSKYMDTQHTVFLGDINDEYNMSAKGFGFHGGLGVEISLSNQLALLIESRGRYVRLNGFEGDLKSSWSSSSSIISGKLWYYEISAFDNGKYPIVSVENTKPLGPDIANVREAIVDTSGISVFLGLIFRF